MKIVVGIATAGRRDLVGQVVSLFRHQTRLPESVIICPATEHDYESMANTDCPFPVKVVAGGKGLPLQRNLILNAATDADVVVFFDDDFVCEENFLAELEALFLKAPDIVVATGNVIADGARSIGITLDDALAQVSSYGKLPPECLRPVFNAYGCNMAIRANVVSANRLKFDEMLPLYAWWEDVDFSRQMAAYGKIMHSNRLVGVHMGSKSGRTPGQRLGYAQIANIVYMMQKGTVPLHLGTYRISMNLIANAVRQFSPEPWVDRRGRFIGNMKAIADCLQKPADPQKILTL